VHKAADEDNGNRPIVQTQLRDGQMPNHPTKPLPNETLLIVNIKIIIRSAEHSILKRPRHAVLQVPVEPLVKKPAHVPEERRVEDRSEDRRGVVRRGFLLERVEGHVGVRDQTGDAKELGEEGGDDAAWEGVSEFAADVPRGVVYQEEGQDASTKVEIVRQHGGWLCEKYLPERSPRVAREDGEEECVEPI